jgi:membrane-bound serine protease (ClpP class)
VVTGSEGMIGEIGTAVTPLAPDGKVFVRGEYWNATAASPRWPPAAACASLPSDRLKLTVEPIPPRNGAST